MTAPLVLLPALGTDARLWDDVASRLPARLPVLRVDHPGHGGAPVEDGRTVAQLAARLLCMLDAQGIESCHLAGVSLGAAVALHVAVHHPARVRSLTLAHTAARFGSAELWAMRITTARRDGLAALADATLARWLTPEHAAADPALVQRLRAMFIATDPEGYARCCEAVRDFDGAPLLKGVRAPALVVAGLHDTATPPALQRELQQGIVHASGLQLPGAHLGLLAAPAPFAQALLALIDEGDHLWKTT